MRQGVDGSLVTIEPHGVGFILTSILLDVDPKPNKRCRLRVAVSNVDDENSTHPLEYMFPLTPVGTYGRISSF